MYRFVQDLEVMYNNSNFDGMEQVLKWRIEDIEMKMGRTYALVTGYVDDHVFGDI